MLLTIYFFQVERFLLAKSTREIGGSRFRSIAVPPPRSNYPQLQFRADAYSFSVLHTSFLLARALRPERPRQIFAFVADSPRVSRHESINDQLSFGRVGTYCRLVNL